MRPPTRTHLAPEERPTLVPLWSVERELADCGVQRGFWAGSGAGDPRRQPGSSHSTRRGRVGRTLVAGLFLTRWCDESTLTWKHGKEPCVMAAPCPGQWSRSKRAFMAAELLAAGSRWAAGGGGPLGFTSWIAWCGRCAPTDLGRPKTLRTQRLLQ